MKMYTNSEQTAKLIELGFAPKMRINGVCTKYGIVNVEHETYFDVGELIEMLPKELEKYNWDFYSINIYFDTFIWNVCYKNRKGQIAYQTSSIEELVNALFEMAVKLKEDGVI